MISKNTILTYKITIVFLKLLIDFYESVFNGLFINQKTFY